MNFLIVIVVSLITACSVVGAKPTPSIDDHGDKVYTWELERYNNWD